MKLMIIAKHIFIKNLHYLQKYCYKAQDSRAYKQTSELD